MLCDVAYGVYALSANGLGGLVRERVEEEPFEGGERLGGEVVV